MFCGSPSREAGQEVEHTKQTSDFGAGDRRAAASVNFAAARLFFFLEENTDDQILSSANTELLL